MNRHRQQPLRPETPSSQTSAAQAIPLATSAALSAWLLSQSFPPDMTSVGLLLLLAVGLTLLSRSPLVPALLFLTQAVVAVSESSSLRSTVTFHDQLIAGCLLILLLSLQRYLQIPEPAQLSKIRKQMAGRLRFLRQFPATRGPRTHGTMAFRSTVGGGEFLLLAVRVVAAVVIAAWLLAFVPVNLRAPDDVALIPTAHRTIKLGIILCVGVIVLNTLFNWAAWRRLPPRAARLFLDSQLTEWCGHEIRTILRLEEKRKRRRV